MLSWWIFALEAATLVAMYGQNWRNEQRKQSWQRRQKNRQVQFYSVKFQLLWMVIYASTRVYIYIYQTVVNMTQTCLNSKSSGSRERPGTMWHKPIRFLPWPLHRRQLQGLRLSHSFILALSLSLSLTHTHTHTLSLSHTHTLPLSHTHTHRTQFWSHSVSFLNHWILL